MMGLLAEVPTGETGNAKTYTREEMLQSRRLKYLVMSMDFFTMYFRQGAGGEYFRIINPLPADAKIVDMSEHYLFRNNQMTFRVWSSEFPPVEEAALLEEIVLEFETVNVENRLPCGGII